MIGRARARVAPYAEVELDEAKEADDLAAAPPPRGVAQLVYVYTYRMTHRTVESPPSFFSSRCPRPDRD